MRDDEPTVGFAPPHYLASRKRRRRERSPSQKEKWRLLEAETDFWCFGSLCRAVTLEKVENSKLALKELKP